MIFNRSSSEDGQSGNTLIELIVVVGLIAILVAVSLPLFSKYKLRGYKSELDSDTRNAYTAAQIYLVNSPNSTVSSMTMLKSGGYMPSESVTFVSADFSVSSGSLTLKSTALENAGRQNNSVAYYNGRFSLVPSP